MDWDYIHKERECELLREQLIKEHKGRIIAESEVAQLKEQLEQLKQQLPKKQMGCIL